MNPSIMQLNSKAIKCIVDFYISLFFVVSLTGSWRVPFFVVVVVLIIVGSQEKPPDPGRGEYSSVYMCHSMYVCVYVCVYIYIVVVNGFCMNETI